MLFPETPRIRFGRNPLDEVICQLRFPPILRVDSEVPAAFQERVRQTFPLYQSSRAHLPASVALPADVLQAVLGGSAATTHEFLSPDKRSRVALTRDFIALTVQDYSTWADFKTAMDGPVAALAAVYQPAFVTRVGLRYRDRIDRRAIQREATPWSALLRPELAAELGSADVGHAVRHILRELIFELPGGAGQLRVVHGLDPESQGNAYIIDADCFIERQLPLQGATDVLANFNREAGNFFRWCISDTLRDALEPHDA